MSAAGTPRELAETFVRRPGMFLGDTVTFERAVGWIHGVESALLLLRDDAAAPLPTGDLGPLLRPGSAATTPRTDEQEREDILTLLPVLERVFEALQRLADER